MWLMNRAEVIARLRATEPALRAHGVGALYLFGSYARDEARADSDLDLFVDADAEIFYSLNHYMGAYESLKSAFPDVDIGFSSRDGLIEFYRPEIENEAIRVF
jgi:predicted nucleotidyltransferase